RRGLALREQPGRLDDDLDAHVLPRQVGRIALGDHAHVLAVDDQLAVARLDRAGKAAVHRVVAQQMSRDLRLHQVVDGDDLVSGTALTSGAKDVAADAPKPVDANAYAH